MATKTNDASYRFVNEANRKEALNLRKRLAREERAKNPNPLASLFSAALMAAVTVMYGYSEDTKMVFLFAFFTVFHLVFAYINWKKQRA